MELSSVVLMELPHRAQVRAPEEDWAGVTNPAERRKLQNRLNQRLYRQRRAGPNSKLLAKRSILATPGHEKPSETPTAAAPKDLQIVSFTANQQRLNTDHDAPHSTYLSIHTSTFSEIEAAISKFETRARQDLLTGSPRADTVLTLIQFNVWRALVDNMTAMGFGNDWYQSEDAISPYYSTGAQMHADQKTNWSMVPSHLRPTRIQRKIEHHPWIDLLPHPRLRDNLIIQSGNYDEYELCNDLLEFEGISNENTGLIVWDRPFDPAGWEMSERFVRKWTWAIIGCDDFIISTNTWRAKRGEPALLGLIE